MLDVISLKKVKDVDKKYAVKTATIEKELSDFQNTLANVNINQEAKQSATGYGVVSLPKNCANGQVSASIKGSTLTQLADNGIDYGNWVIEGAGSTKGPRGIHLVQDGFTEFARLNTNLKPYTQYTLVLNVENYNLTSLLSFNNTQVLGGNSYAITPKIGLNKLLFTTGSITINRIDFAIGSANADGTYIDFRLFGVYEGDQINNPLVDHPMSYGTKSTVSAVRLRSVGKNVWGGERAIDDITKTVNNSSYAYRTTIDSRNVLALKAHDSIIKSVFDKFEPNTQYTISVEGKRNDNYGGYFVVDYTDGTSVAVAPPTTSWSLIKVTTAIGKSIKNIKMTYGNIEAVNYYNIDSFQVEKGTAATSYTPYIESNLYLNAGQPLRSLPNGVKDEVSPVAGGYELVKRVGEHAIGGGDIDRMITSFADVDAAQVKQPIDMYNFPSNDDAVRKHTLIYEYAEVPFNERMLVSSIGKYYINAATIPNSICFVVAKGTTLAQAQQALAGTTLTYQLATPEIIPIQTSGSLFGYPSGTVYVENVLPVAGIYEQTGIKVTNSSFPIATIERISKIDPITGVETDIPVSDAVVAGDKLSFTHSQLVRGDIVFFTYYYDVESTVGETTITYYDSRHTIKDSGNGKFYQWKITANNGVPSISLVEV